ncbi:SDR family oxidoreductase [Candidatus Peregrinibacteria bacterium]|nr:SDR family oxidoreductase [Candidatus Peregrinibacteria bacterium]
MRVLVAGGAGFIGSYLCDALLRRGNEVICVDNFLTSTPQNVAHLQGNSAFQMIEHDIRKPLAVDGKIDSIYNLACPASPIDYQNLPVETLETSAIGTGNLLHLSREKNAIFLHASTSEVYGDPLEHPQKESYFGNVNCIGVRSCYDEGKRYAESLIIHFSRQFSVKIKIVRIFNTYGPRMRKHDGRVISNFITQALANEPLALYGDGYQTRSFCYVSDMVDGILKMMDMKNFSGPVNLGNPEEISIRSLAKHVIEYTSSRSEIHTLPSSEDDPKVRRPDITLASKKLGFSPDVSLENGLKLTIKWFTNNED